MKRWKDVFIDFDDTLYDTRGNAVIALRELYEDFHLEQYFVAPDDFFNPYWEANIMLWSRYTRQEITRDELIVERFRQPLSKGHGTDLSREYCLKMSDHFLDLCSVKSGIIDGARELLEYLRGCGYRIHMCSNGFQEVQYRKLESCGLGEFFDSVILSEDAGHTKPAREFFDYALMKTEAKRETTIMIGDNYNTDIEGAMNAGLDTVLFQRWDRDFVPPKQPTFIARTLLDIKGML